MPPFARSSRCFARRADALRIGAGALPRAASTAVLAPVDRDRRRPAPTAPPSRSISSSPPAPRRSRLATPAGARRRARRCRSTSSARRPRPPRAPPGSTPQAPAAADVAALLPTLPRGPARFISPAGDRKPDLEAALGPGASTPLVVYEARRATRWDDGEAQAVGGAAAALHYSERSAGAGGRLARSGRRSPRRSGGCRTSVCRARPPRRSPRSASRARCGRASPTKPRCSTRWNRRWPTQRRFRRRRLCVGERSRL